MATQYEPIVKDSTLNTTEQTPRNLADVLASGLANIANNVKPDGSDISIDVPGMSATNVDDGFSELKQSLDDLENNTHKFTISTSDTTIVLPSTYRGVLITSDSDSTRCGMWMIFTYSDGTGGRTAMFSTSTGVVVTGTSNGLKVKTNSGGSYGLIIDISKHVTSIS